MQNLLLFGAVLAVLAAVVFGGVVLIEDTNAPFVTIVLGAAGGLDEDNLNAYLLAPRGSSDYVALDAGTLMAGIRKAHERGSFSDVRVPREAGLTLEGWVLQQIKAYLISHAHLDHVAGMVLNSPDDTSKPILASATTIDDIQKNLFNWRIWPNFGNEGEGFLLEKYTYTRLNPGEEVSIEGTKMTVEAHPLSHSSPYESTAFLIRSGEHYALFFGDTGPDAVEGGARMRAVWARVAPLVQTGQLRGIFLESSYPEGQPDELLFGHLTPSWLMAELHALAELVDPLAPQDALRGLTVIVTAIKPSLQAGPSTRDQIKKQLNQLNDLGLHFILPRQGDRIAF